MCSVLVSSSCLLLNDTNIMFWLLTRFSFYVCVYSISKYTNNCLQRYYPNTSLTIVLGQEFRIIVRHLVTSFTYVCALPWELSKVSSKTIDVIWLARYTTKMIKIQNNCRITNIQTTQTLVAWCMYSNTHVCVWQSWVFNLSCGKVVYRVSWKIKGFSSKTIKVLLSKRKLTGRKRIAFDSNVHKIAIFSDELENVKQLNFSLQKFESDNIEFEKSVLNYMIVYRKKYVVRGFC